MRESASVSLLKADAGDRKSIKVAWIGALIFHFLLFVVVFPSMGGITFEAAKQDLTIVKRYKPPTPPKEQPKKKVIKKSATRVPIPDPTPDEPEPIVSEEVEFVEDIDIPVDTDFVVGLPTAGPPSLAPEGPVRVGGDIQSPELISRIQPEYPELARRARKEGFVILEATIDKQGNVKDVSVLRPDALGLTEAAMEAVRQWKYTPTYLNGRPVEILLTVTVQFQLSG